MRFLAIIEKDIRSELRSRYGITALALFVVTSISIVAFSAADEPIPKPLSIAMLWIVMFFTALTGMSRAFVQEEERGTWLYLRISVPPTDIYLGKVLYNVMLGSLSNGLACILFLLLFPGLEILSPWLLLLCVVVSSVGLSVVLTILSAIVAKAGSKNSLLPVLSFPLLVPLLMPGTNAMLMAASGFEFAEIVNDLLLMVTYTGIVGVVSWILFPVVWCD